MGDLTNNFNRSEFACKGKDCCSASAPISFELVQALQELRYKVGKKVKILSGFRCNKHNLAVGGSLNSQHTFGLAADVAPPAGITPEQLAAMAETIGAFKTGGIGTYKTFVHLDIRRGGPSRWKG